MCEYSLELLSIVLSGIAIIVAIISNIVVNWWQNKKTEERLQESFKSADDRLKKTLYHEIELRNVRVQKMFYYL